MAIFEQLMGTSRPKLRHCLGIYLSLEGACIAETRLEGNSVRIIRFMKVPFPQPKKPENDQARATALNADFFEAASNWLDPLENAVRQVKWGTGKVVVALSPQFAVFRHFIMPYVERRFWKQSIPLEAKKYIPFPFEQSVYDFHIYQHGSSEIKGKLGILFALTSKRISDSVAAGMAKLGFELAAIEVSAMSADRVLGFISGDGGRGKVYAHFDAGNGYLLLSNGGIPLLFRAVSFGDLQSTERRRLDAKGSIDFVCKQLEEQIFSDVLLSGENLDLWKTVVEDDSKLPVKIWDPRQIIGVQDGNWGAYAAVGAGMRFMDAAEYLGVDLINKIRNTADEQKAAAAVWAAGLGLAALVLLISLVIQLRLMILSGELSSLKRTITAVPEFEGKPAPQIESIVDIMRKQAAALSALLSNQDKVTPKLAALAETVPDKMWLSSIDYASPFSLGRGQGAEVKFVIRGQVRTGSDKTDEAMLVKYREDFKSHPAVSSVYGGPKARVDLNYSLSSKQTAGKNGHALVRGDTSFSLTCAKKPEGE